MTADIAQVFAELAADIARLDAEALRDFVAELDYLAVTFELEADGVESFACRDDDPDGPRLIPLSRR